MKQMFDMSEKLTAGQSDEIYVVNTMNWVDTVKTTPQMTRFRDAKVCNNWLQIRIDDHRIQSYYKYKSELQNPEGKTSVLGITSAWWNRAGDFKIIFRTILCTLSIGLMKCGRAKCQDKEATREDFNIVLIHQDKKFFVSELFKVIQDATPLVLHHRTMYWFRTISSSTFIMLDVQSICTPSQIEDWYREDKIWARKDRLYSLRLWIPWTRNTKVRTSLIWPNHVLHGTSRKRGTDTKTRCSGSIFQIAQRKGLKFYQTRSNAVTLCDTLPACISKAIVMKSEEIIYEKVYMSLRPPPTISYKDNWTCNLDSDVARCSKDIQRIELKPNTQLSSTGRLVTRWREETLERTKFDRDTLN